MAKLVVLALLLIGFSPIFGLPEELQKLANILHETCVKETNVDEKLIQEVRYGTFTEDPVLKCYMKCILTTLNVMDDKGNINVDVIVDVIIPEKYRKIAEPVLRKCDTVRGSDDCDTAFQTNKCWHEYGPLYYYLP